MDEADAYARKLVGYIADEYAMCILALTNNRVMNTQDISDFGTIPVAMAYRTVKKLVETGLLEVSRKSVPSAPSGKLRVVRFYQSRVEKLDCSTTFLTNSEPPKSIVTLKLKGQEPRTLEVLLLQPPRLPAEA